MMSHPLGAVGDGMKKGGFPTRLAFELDHRPVDGTYTAHAGVPLLIEAFRNSGAGAVLDEKVVIKQRKRGLTPWQTVESLFALWACGGERCEDLDALRADGALGVLIGHSFPAPQTARDFLDAFDEALPPLWQGELGASVPAESEQLQGLFAANRRLVAFLQERSPCGTATIDIDATILSSDKRAARATYQGTTGYQPVIALWAEQDMVLADEFRDGNVPPQSGNLRLVQRAVAALPEGVEAVRVRSDSAGYTHDLMRWLEDKKHGYAISAKMHPPLLRAVKALPESAWHFEREDGEAVRHWAEVAYVPNDRDYSDRRGTPARYLATRIMKKQGHLFADGSQVRYWALVTNLPDPEGGSGLDLLRWHRGKAGTVELAHDVLTNELAAEALPSQKFGANAAWFRLNVMLYNLLSAFKKIALPPDLHRARPKRLRFVLLNTIGKVVRHARETLLRMTSDACLRLADRARLALAAGCRVIVPLAA